MKDFKAKKALNEDKKKKKNGKVNILVGGIFGGGFF